MIHLRVLVVVGGLAAGDLDVAQGGREQVVGQRGGAHGTPAETERRPGPQRLLQPLGAMAGWAARVG